MHIYRLNHGEFRAWRNRGARADLKQRIYENHGETQLRAPSGRILGTARAADKSGHIPIEKSVPRGAHHAISPRECICREWQKPAGKEQEHHPICANKSHWEAQQLRSPDVLRERALLGADAVSAPAVEPTTDGAARDTERPPAGIPAQAEPPVAAPADCVCQDWAGTEQGKHHALCQFRERWEREHGAPTPSLVELETGKFVREASPEEIESSKQKAEEDGVGAIELSDGKLYYVRSP
ncbi:MAG TPA: hypothetical protein VG937_00065 [Polyangiaceae bacterium]|nr:hypothetical protein [Polyangiaceae bacterium]